MSWARRSPASCSLNALSEIAFAEATLAAWRRSRICAFLRNAASQVRITATS
jgi:hypothetical protein